MPALVALVLMLAFLLWQVWGRQAWRARSGPHQRCDWELLKTQKPMQEFCCKTCGVVAYSNTGKPPRECKREFKGGL